MSVHPQSIAEWVDGIRANNRSILGRAITLVESTRPADRELARELMAAIYPFTGQSHRIGLTGVPGVGKSTFVDKFGSLLIQKGHRVAVLAVDPSSPRTGGSILGDKTRMHTLSVNPNAFVRPSPTAGTLGGVANRTREAMLLCEAANYDVVIIETVGVGQSELSVREMTDVFLLLMLAGAGDELQGIKRGLMETADIVAINKADGDNQLAAKRAAHTYRSALHLLRGTHDGWEPRVMTCSGLHGDGLAEVWGCLQEHRNHLVATNQLDTIRRKQRRHWMWSLINSNLRTAFRAHPNVQQRLNDVEHKVLTHELPPTEAAQQLLRAFLESD